MIRISIAVIGLAAAALLAAAPSGADPSTASDGAAGTPGGTTAPQQHISVPNVNRVNKILYPNLFTVSHAPDGAAG